MKISHIRSLLIKDLHTGFRNNSIIIFILLPLAFTLFYKTVTLSGRVMESFYTLKMGILMTVCTIPISAMATTISEEKERFTLRSLMMSSVSAMEFLISKAIFIFGVTEVTGCGVYFISQSELPFPIFISIFSTTAITLMSLGATIGIICSNQMTTSAYTTPIILSLLVPVALSGYNESIDWFAKLLPTQAMIELFNLNNIIGNVLIILIWNFIGLLLFSLFYRIRRLDS